ncbi:MAG: cytochrome c oxidase assembly protein [Solirubrobacterales bacterium]|nr:cytochrome c oxidase assembly protein [Solirubrobacterales bacterium]
MSLRSLALDWTIDPSAAALLAQLAAAAALYLAAVNGGNRHARPARRWPKYRTVFFLSGLAAAAIDLCSGIGTQADSRLSAHMLEHMILWIIVAPLLAAGAPVRLAFHALPRAGRHRLARCLHSRTVSALTSPVGSVSLFSAAILVTHIPAVYGLALTNDYLHESEHVLYLLTALLVWAPLIGADPLPHRAAARNQFVCVVACMLPMVLIALWLATTPSPVYGHYLAGLGPQALHDQRLAATIMWAGGLLALAVPALAQTRISRPRRRQQTYPHQAPA